jgi:hypothetical protein
VSDPTGKRALFEAAGGPTAPIADRRPNSHATGKAALFSTPPRQAGTAVIDCSSCRTRSRVSLAEVIRRLVTGSAWLPIVRPSHPHWLRCPACERWRWCRIGWTE